MAEVVAVTGANGFIASHIVDLLLKEGYTVRAIVRDKDNNDKTAHLKKLADDHKAQDKLSFHSGDLLKAGTYDDAFKGADAVVHTAAVVLLQHKNPQAAIVDPSIEGTRNVLASADKAGSIKKFIHTSSVAAIMNMNDPDRLHTEEDENTWGTVANGGAYGYAKYNAEQMVRKHCEKKETTFQCAFINPSIVLGPCMIKAHTKASPAVIRQVIYGNEQANYFASFVDVRDVAQAHVSALKSVEKFPGQRFILSGSPNTHAFWMSELGSKLQPLFDKYTMTSPCYPWYKVALMRLFWRLTTFEIKMLTAKVTYDNTKSQEVLGVKYHSLDDTLRDTASSMIDSGFIKPRNKL